jgi:Undecaprenyl-phosphate galactose phosphotransferase WbaP
MGAAGLLAAVALPVCRGLSRVLVARTQWWRRPAVVLGTDPLAASVVDTLDRWPELGLRPVALLRAGADAPIPASGGPPVLGDFTAAPALALRHGIRHAVLAAPDVAPERRARLLSRYAQYFDQVMDVSDAHRGQVLWQLKYCSEGLVGTEVRHYALRRSERAVKRAIDLIGAGLALVLGAPLMAAAALLVRLDSPGPVFFRQQRMGRDGRCFPVLKFRTMHVDADERLEQILRQDPERREQYERYHKLTDDPRVTRIGRLLRRYSIDELPQLINVLRGEMSLVGPRAYMPRELPKMKRLNPVVLQTPPGITGLWQVSGRNAVSFERRVDLDVHYILNWSPWLDLYLLVRTLPVVLTGQGAS